LTFIKRIKNLIDFKNRQFDQRVLIFFFFFLLSTIFWFLNALNKEYISDIKYPVRFINFPQNKILVNKLPKKLTFTVESYGYKLLKYKIRPSVLPIVFSVNAYPLRPVTYIEDNKFYILTDQARGSLVDQLSSEIRVIEIKPDSIILELADLKNKKVKVKPDIEVVLEKPFMLKQEIISKPDSIILRGPDNLLDTISFVKTKFQKIKNIEETVIKNISLVEIDDIIFSTKKVELTISVDKFTESSLKIPVYIKNLPDSILVKTFPSNIDITFLVALTDFKSITNDSFRAIVDYDLIKNSEEDFATIYIEESPVGIKNLRFSPHRVEYIIEE